MLPPFMHHTRYRIKKEDKHWSVFWKQVDTQKSKKLTSYKMLRKTVLHNFVHGQSSLSIDGTILNSTSFLFITSISRIFSNCSGVIKIWWKHSWFLAANAWEVLYVLPCQRSFRATLWNPIAGYALTLMVL